VTAAQVREIFGKMRSGGGFESLTPAERQVMQQIRTAGGGRARGGAAGGGTGGRTTANDAAFGGDYVVFVRRGETLAAVPVRTGLTDLDYSEVVSGLAETDTVLVLPSASLVAQQQEFSQRLQRMRGAGLPGVQQQPAAGTTPSTPARPAR
jgi:hypothetical protein